jgi:sulfhydrogenase subunit gamma (sulfur reductase)
MNNTAISKSKLYKPFRAQIIQLIKETPDITTFRLRIEEPSMTSFTFSPGNFVLISVFGHGEAPFAIASSPFHRDSIEISVKRMGKVTQALHELVPKTYIGVRGPYGNHFLRAPLDHKDLVFIAGGIGMAPLRPLILSMLEERHRYGEITLIVGAQTPVDIPYRRELAQWEKIDQVRLVKTVDSGGETPDWHGQVGLVPTVLSQVDFAVNEAVAFICGPPIMIRLSADVLVKKGWAQDQILTTLENKMTCGMGKCGRCNIGAQYVCQDGPVFSYEELQYMQMSDYW